MLHEDPNVGCGARALSRGGTLKSISVIAYRSRPSASSSADIDDILRSAQHRNRIEAPSYFRWDAGA